MFEPQLSSVYEENLQGKKRRSSSADKQCYKEKQHVKGESHTCQGLWVEVLLPLCLQTGWQLMFGRWETRREPRLHRTNVSMTKEHTGLILMASREIVAGEHGGFVRRQRSFYGILRFCAPIFSLGRTMWRLGETWPKLEPLEPLAKHRQGCWVGCLAWGSFAWHST